jgi:hypothetical protein
VDCDGQHSLQLDRKRWDFIKYIRMPLSHYFHSPHVASH